MHLRRDACCSGTPGSTIPQKISIVFCGCFCNSCRGNIVAWNIWEASKHHQTISNIQCRPSNKTTRYNRCMSASITNNSAPTPQTWISNLPHDHASKVQLMHCDEAPRDIVQIYIKCGWLWRPATLTSLELLVVQTPCHLDRDWLCTMGNLGWMLYKCCHSIFIYILCINNLTPSLALKKRTPLPLGVTGPWSKTLIFNLYHLSFIIITRNPSCWTQTECSSVIFEQYKALQRHGACVIFWYWHDAPPAVQFFANHLRRVASHVEKWRYGRALERYDI